MRVHFARIGAGDGVDAPAAEFEHLSTLDAVGKHDVTDDPRQADLILFTQCHAVDWRLLAIRGHKLVKRYPKKVMVYDIRDRPWRSFPGVYVSTPARDFDARSQRAWGYPRVSDPPVRGTTVEPDLLFSFVGSATAQCRELIFELRHEQAVVEQVQSFQPWDTSRPGYEALRRRYDEILCRSRFVLCPRGHGTSSLRLYEALAAGRVPVIISDDWVPPSGPDWPAFSLRWPERRMDGLIALLEERDPEWREMGAAAAEAYAKYFAADVAFHRVVELCRDLHETHRRPPSQSTLWRRSVAAALGERFSRDH
jgi:hypothetical protein